MLDALFKPKARDFFDSMAGRMSAGGVSANKATMTGFALGICACFAAASQTYPLAILLIILNRFFKGLAGGIASATAVTPKGSYLDLLCDIAFFAAFPFFFILGAPEHSMAAAFLLFSYLAMFTAWMGQGLFNPARAGISLPEGGLIGQTEMTIFLILCCTLPVYFSAFAAVYGIACFCAAAMRITRALKDINGSSNGKISQE